MPKIMPSPRTRKDEAASQSDGLDEVVALMRKVADSGGFESVRAAINDNEALRERVSALEVAFAESATAVAKKQAEIESATEQQKLDRESHRRVQDELMAKKKDAADKDKQIEDQEKQLNNLIAQIKAKETRLNQLQHIETARNGLKEKLAKCQSALESSDKELARVSRSLETSESFRAPFRTLHNDGNRISSLLDHIFLLASRLIVDWLQADLDENRLSNTERWEALREHGSINRAIPLPPSNSAPAKSMRVAAGLSVYATALAKHVMKPTYLLQDDDSLRALVSLARQDQAQNACVRAVLLKAFPDRCKAVKERQIDMVVKEVVDAVGWCARRKDGETFQVSVKGVTVKIADSWDQVQTLEEMVRPSFITDFAEDWAPLRTQPAAGSPASVPGTSAQRSKQNEQSHINGHVQAGSTAVVRPVWPSFLHLGPTDTSDELLRPGYGLTDGQLEKAREEFSRRAQRKSTRQSSHPSNQKRDSGIFLSAGGSNGPGNE